MTRKDSTSLLFELKPILQLAKDLIHLVVFSSHFFPRSVQLGGKKWEGKTTINYLRSYDTK